MPLNDSPSPLAPPPSPLVANAGRVRPAGGVRIALGALCGVGVAVLVGMAALGEVRPVVALLASGLLVLAALVLAVLMRPPRPGTDPGALAVPPSPGEAQTYALALELAPNPVALISGDDPDDFTGRRVVFANAEARALLRIPREGAFLVSAVRNPAVLEAIDEALFGQIGRDLEYDTGGADGRIWRVWTKPLPAAEPHRRLALVILRDETDVRANARMRADFLANASHELRTPLASLSGFIETLRGHARDDAAARERFLLIMSRQAGRMARLIDDLLSLSRIELNEHIRPAGACDLTLAVNDVADALAPQLHAKSIRLQLDLPAVGGAEVVGDRDQIVQVVQNLLDNAIKYAPAGSAVGVGVTPGLSLEAASASRPAEPRLQAASGGRMPLLTPVRAPAARYAAIRVEDRGSGMAREHLPRLTERFYRVEGQKSGERSGTGLGLAIVKHIVNRHRGGFLVESAPGEGAAFCVYLPMRAGAPARPPQTSPPPTPEAAPA